MFGFQPHRFCYSLARLCVLNVCWKNSLDHLLLRKPIGVAGEGGKKYQSMRGYPIAAGDHTATFQTY